MTQHIISEELQKQIGQLDKLDHDWINKLTEHKENYKQFNVALMDAYVCLKPDCIAKICCSLFNCILSTKRYQNPKSAYYNELEDKRIYSDIPLTPEILLRRYDPFKYKGEEKSTSADVGNFVKRLQQIEDMNIFYMWRYGRPYLYMFTMERDIGVWKCFNDKAFVSPKTIKKILACSKGMTNTMAKMVKIDGRAVNRTNIEDSYGEFINHMLSKMNPAVSHKLSKWKGRGNVFDYLGILSDELTKLQPYEGIEKNSELMIKSLPESVIKKILEDKHCKTKEKNMNCLELERELVPENEDLISAKTHNKRHYKSNANFEAKKQPLASVDPFQNCNNFMRFYTAAIKLHNDGAQLYPFESERKYALDILDMLTALGRKDNKIFLKALIQYFIDNKLTGNNIYKPECTSIKALKEILPIYNRKYIA